MQISTKSLSRWHHREVYTIDTIIVVVCFFHIGLVHSGLDLRDLTAKHKVATAMAMALWKLPHLAKQEVSSI